MEIEVRASPSAEEVAAFLEIESDELAERDQFQRPIGRWLASDGHTSVGLATASIRPDDRLFVTHRIRSEATFGPLLKAAIDDLDQPIHLSIAHSQADRLRSALQAGFIAELNALTFDVPFQPALLKTAGHRSNRIETVQADQVPSDELFALDIDLRQDVPGIDGWRGNRTWFDDEMASPEFDPTGYLVARDRNSGYLVGLCRFWKKSQGPTLGMIGIRPTHRTGRPALVLLHETMLAASQWGFDTFTTHTAHASLQRRLRALGADQTGAFTQLQRVP